MNVNINKVKIVVSIPLEYVDSIREAMCNNGAGIIGNYEYCSTLTKSTGTFKPMDKSHPYIGKVNKLEFVEEGKLEVICDIKVVKKVLNELKKAHPYEEPAIDIIPLIDEDYFN